MDLSLAGSTKPSSNGVTDVASRDRKKAFHRVRDISKGSEKVKISLADEIGLKDLPKFVYCPESIAYESANVHIALARIADEDCCVECEGDCLWSSLPCACAGATGGEFAYSTDGLLVQSFLQSCLILKQSPDSRHLVYCKDCPLERAKNSDLPGKCQGHVLKRFIKECWRKCGCNMMCGNRVVQRGITRKLEVSILEKEFQYL